MAIKKFKALVLYPRLKLFLYSSFHKVPLWNTSQARIVFDAIPVFLYNEKFNPPCYSISKPTRTGKVTFEMEISIIATKVMKERGEKVGENYS